MAHLLTPAQLIGHLLANAPAQLRAQVLTTAKQTNQRLLQQLDDERLQNEEQGWTDHWRTRHDRTTQTLAAIEQALATC